MKLITQPVHTSATIGTGKKVTQPVSQGNANTTVLIDADALVGQCSLLWSLLVEINYN